MYKGFIGYSIHLCIFVKYSSVWKGKVWFWMRRMLELNILLLLWASYFLTQYLSCLKMTISIPPMLKGHEHLIEQNNWNNYFPLFPSIFHLCEIVHDQGKELWTMFSGQFMLKNGAMSLSLLGKHVAGFKHSCWDCVQSGWSERFLCDYDFAYVEIH